MQPSVYTEETLSTQKLVSNRINNEILYGYVQKHLLWNKINCILPIIGNICQVFAWMNLQNN